MMLKPYISISSEHSVRYNNDINFISGKWVNFKFKHIVRLSLTTNVSKKDLVFTIRQYV